MTSSPWIELSRRVRVMLLFWQQGLDDITVDQVNHQERPGVLPITFSLFHYVTGEDRAISQRILGEPMLWSDDWAARTGITLDPITRGTPIAVAEQVRMSDLAAWRDYQTAVFTRTDRVLPEVPTERWNEVVFDRVPDALKGGFAAHLAGDGPVILGDLMDVFLYQHGMRHLGEIEHGRALVGLEGIG